MAPNSVSTARRAEWPSVGWSNSARTASPGDQGSGAALGDLRAGEDHVDAVANGAVGVIENIGDLGHGQRLSGEEGLVGLESG